MMQHKFLLFSAVCCGLLQAILCGGADDQKTSPSTMFRPRFSSRPSFSSTSTSSVISGNNMDEILKQLGQPSAESSTTKQEGALAAPSGQTEPTPLFRSRFSSQPSLSSTSASSAMSGNNMSEILNQLGQPSAESTTKREGTLAAPSQTESIPDEEPAAEPAAEPVEENSVEENSVEENSVEENSEDEISADESPSKGAPSSSKKKKSSKALSRTASKKKGNPNDPLNISDIDQLKVRAKELIRNLLKDENANRAITQLAINAKDLLKNEVASNIILTHTHLIKDTLMNEEARDIIKDLRMDIASTFMNKDTPQKVKYAFEKSKECLAREDLPKMLRKRFKMLKKILKNEKTYPAMVSLKNAVVRFVNTPDIKTEIAKGFKLLDFGIHFDPNNVMKSLGLPISFFK